MSLPASPSEIPEKKNPKNPADLLADLQEKVPPNVPDLPARTANLKEAVEGQKPQPKVSELLKLAPSELLAKTTKLEGQAGKPLYAVCFPNDAIQQAVGLGNVLASQYRFVAVWKEGSNTPIWGHRAITTFRGEERIGYVDTDGKYIPIVTGDHFMPYESLPTSPSAGDTQKGEVLRVSAENLGDVRSAIPAQFLSLQENDFPDSKEEEENRQEYVAQITRRETEMDRILAELERNFGKNMREGTIADFMSALMRQESGGKYGIANERTGAYGRYQILPSNWPSWSQEAGLEKGSEPTPANQEKVALFKIQQYYAQYGNWADVASMWYSGRPFERVVRAGWVDQKQGNGDEPSVKEYVTQVLVRMERAA